MQGLVDEWHTKNEARMLCEVYAKLLGLLVQHRVLLLTCWEDPHRSWITVSEIVRDQAVVLAHGFSGRLLGCGTSPPAAPDCPEESARHGHRSSDSSSVRENACFQQYSTRLHAGGSDLPGSREHMTDPTNL